MSNGIANWQLRSVIYLIHYQLWHASGHLKVFNDQLGMPAANRLFAMTIYCLRWRPLDMSILTFFYKTFEGLKTFAMEN